MNYKCFKKLQEGQCDCGRVSIAEARRSLDWKSNHMRPGNLTEKDGFCPKHHVKYQNILSK